MEYAASSELLNIVRFLHQTYMKRCTQNAMNSAAPEGHFGIVKLFHYRKNGIHSAKVECRRHSGGV